MSGTVAGGKKAAERIHQLYGADYYSRIGIIGGKKGRTGGFYGNSTKAAEAGRVGGHNGAGKTKRQPRRRHRDAVAVMV